MIVYMGVGRNFSRGGTSGFFWKFFLGGPKVVKFYIYHSKISKEPFWLCCDRKVRAACAQSFTLWRQATIEITHNDHCIIAFSRHIYTGVVLRAHSVRGESCIQRNASGEVATAVILKFLPSSDTHMLVCRNKFVPDH